MPVQDKHSKHSLLLFGGGKLRISRIVVNVIVADPTSDVVVVLEFDLLRWSSFGPELFAKPAFEELVAASTVAQDLGRRPDGRSLASLGMTTSLVRLIKPPSKRDDATPASPTRSQTLTPHHRLPHGRKGIAKSSTSPMWHDLFSRHFLDPVRKLRRHQEFAQGDEVPWSSPCPRATDAFKAACHFAEICHRVSSPIERDRLHPADSPSSPSRFR
jgi:hypothetical protein